MTEKGLHPGLQLLLAKGKFSAGCDGIYASECILPEAVPEQAQERQLRERVAAAHYDDYMCKIAESHSIEVVGY